MIPGNDHAQEQKWSSRFCKNILSTHLEKATKKDDKTFWKVFAAQADAGKLNNLEPFKGLVMAVAVRRKWESSGKALTGVVLTPIQKSLDDIGCNEPTRGSISSRNIFWMLPTKSTRSVSQEVLPAGQWIFAS
ncbi:hypothetical protein VP01_1993g3 [Puccinia sorghi]|uniref:Uncharacterized protein n=1 Tax=Puccinia sorghi TaxID=27349 RepID=A0A0L6VBL5_9BASI|nr:hypothetical protein VP01_1993g3 [Puccinia sorghi]